MKVKCQNAVDSGGYDQVGYQLRGDWLAAGCLFFLLGEGVVGDDRRDPRRGSPLRSVDHEKQFHEGGSGRVAHRMDDETVRSTHVFLELDPGLAVLPGSDVGPSQRRL